METKRGNNEGSIFVLVHDGVTGSVKSYFCHYFLCVCLVCKRLTVGLMWLSLEKQ